MQDLLCIGAPLLDIHAEATATEVVESYKLTMHAAVHATPALRTLPSQLAEREVGFEFDAGGSACLTAIVVQGLLTDREKAEGHVTVLGGIGRDEHGATIKETLANHGIQALLSETESQDTGWRVILQTKREDKSEGLGPAPGEDRHEVGFGRTICVFTGAASEYKLDHLRFKVWESVERAKIVYVDSFFLTVSAESVQIVAEHCAKMQKTLCLNLSAGYLCDFFSDKVLSVLPYADYTFGNAAEYAKLAERLREDSESGIDEIAAWVAKMPQADPKKKRYVVVTDGHAPAIVASTWRGHGVKVQRYPIPPIRTGRLQCKDGAGDAFAGGFLHGLMQQADLDTCVASALYAAQVAVQRQGPHFTFKDRPW